MALTGAELNVIETAPLGKPIQTIVKSYDEKLVTEVIRREIARGGQVFYLHNRVQTIDMVALALAGANAGDFLSGRPWTNGRKAARKSHA